MPPEFWEWADTATKIGLGGVIAGILSLYLAERTARHQRSADERRFKAEIDRITQQNAFERDKAILEFQAKQADDLGERRRNNIEKTLADFKDVESEFQRMALALPRLADQNEHQERRVAAVKLIVELSFDKLAIYQKRLSGIGAQVFLIAGEPGRAAMDGYTNKVNELLGVLNAAEPYDTDTGQFAGRLPSLQDCKNFVAVYAAQARRVEDALLKAYEKV